MSEFIREYIPMALRLEVYFMDNFTCVYCGTHQPNQQIDHRLPVTLGGPSIIENLVTCCFECNMRKGNRPDYKCGMVAIYGRFAYSQTLLNIIPTATPLLPKPKSQRILELNEIEKQQIKELANQGMKPYQIAQRLGGRYQTKLEKVKEVLEIKK